MTAQLPEPPPVPAVEPAPAPAGAADLPRAGDEGMRFGYNDGLDAGTPKLGLLPESGSDTVRLRMNWSSSSRSRASTTGALRRELYTQLLGMGIEAALVPDAGAVLGGDPRYACIDNAGSPGVDHAADLGAFAAAVAQRYPESLAIEIGNEQNDPRFWPNGQDPVGFTRPCSRRRAPRSRPSTRRCR